MFFDRWHDIYRLIVVGALTYFGLIFLQRVTGKRTLSKLNAFDLIVTVAFGSTLATALLTTDISLVEALSAFALLIALQYAVTWLSVRSKIVDRLIKTDPKLLLYEGKFLENEMFRERVTRDEVLQAIRAQNISRVEDVEAVVLETDGSFSVVKRTDAYPSALENLELPE